MPLQPFQETIASDEYVHLCINAMEKVQKEHRAEKRRLYGIALVNLASVDEFAFELSDHFVSLLAEINEADLAILRFLCERGVQQKEDTDLVFIRGPLEYIERCPKRNAC